MWMQIAKYKGVEDVGHMEEKVKEMRKELRNISWRQRMHG